jgi:hypothetical protein
MADIERTTTPNLKETRSGLVGEFAAFFHVKPGQADNLRKAALEYANSPARNTAGDPKRGEQIAIVTGIHDIRVTLFDNDTRLLFATSFDTAWDPYVDDSIAIMTGVWPWGHFLKYTVEAPDGIEIKGKISQAAAKDFLNKHRVNAAAFMPTFPALSNTEIIRALKVLKAFEEVLDNPAAEKALQDPALKPLLDQAST